MVIQLLILLYQWFVALPFALVLTVLTAVVTIIGSFCFGSLHWGYYPGMIWSRFLCFLTWQRIEVRGKENFEKGTSYIFTPNHQGVFDIFLIYGYIGTPFKWVMKQELRKVPFIGKACEYAGHIYIDRANPHSIARSIDEAKKRLKDGSSVVIFPEGSRTKTGRLQRFKRGAFVIASDLQIPIVPVTIDGSFTTFTKGKWFVRPNKMILTFHKPISTARLTTSEIPELSQQVREVIASELIKNSAH